MEQIEPLMPAEKELLEMIEKSVKSNAPNTTVILYGSWARGESRADSDVDLLILLDQKRMSREDEKRVNEEGVVL